MTLRRLILGSISTPPNISFREFNAPPDPIVTKPAKKGKKS